MSKLTLFLVSVAFAFCVDGTAHPQASTLSPLAQALSPGKPPSEQKRIMRAVLKTLAIHGETIESRFGVHLFDDRGKMTDPVTAIIKMDHQIMRERGWTASENMLQYVQIKTFGVISGLAFYRLWKIDQRLGIVDCQGHPVRVEQVKTLRREVCSGISKRDCDSLIVMLHEEMARKHNNLSIWLKYSFIDDYGLPCRPYTTFKDMATKLASEFTNADSRRQFAIGFFGMEMGLALFRFSKTLAPENAGTTPENDNASAEQPIPND